MLKEFDEEMNNTVKTEINGIPVEIIRKKIKNLHLYVLPPDGRVRVSAPRKLSDSVILRFVGEKSGWINKRRTMLSNQGGGNISEYVTGEEISILGKRYVLELRYAARGKSFLLDGENAVLTVREDSTAEKREEFVNERLRDLLKAEIEKYLPKWENITGLHPSGWQVKNMKTRWGTCNTRTGKIWLSLQLAKKSEIYLEYVILHELAHLKFKNHGRDFKALLDRYMPDWRTIKKQLNGNI